MENSEREIDQVNCEECGRPVTIWADSTETKFVCSRCKKGLAPEWEY